MNFPYRFFRAFPSILLYSSRRLRLELTREPQVACQDKHLEVNLLASPIGKMFNILCIAVHCNTIADALRLGSTLPYLIMICYVRLGCAYWCWEVSNAVSLRMAMNMSTFLFACSNKHRCKHFSFVYICRLFVFIFCLIARVCD